MKNQSNVLPEEEYLRRLEIIIKRDFYPELFQLDKMRQNQEDENLSLNQFLSQYTSDENVTLSEIIKREDDRWRQKNQWMFTVEDKHRAQQLAIKSNKLQNMIEGSRQNHLMLPDFSALNPLYFKMDKENEGLSDLMLENKKEDLSLQVPKVQIQNTRFDDHIKPFEYAMETINNKLQYQQKKKLQQSLNAQGVKLFFGSTPNLMGQLTEGQHDMVSLYSPGKMSPLMTWGELGETPLRLDRSYMIPQQSQRDKVGSSLTAQLNVKKRNEQKQQQELLKKRLTSMTPNRIGSSISSRANSELIKSFFEMRPTPLPLKKKIQKP